MRNQSLRSNPKTSIAVSAGKWCRPAAMRDFSALYSATGFHVIRGMNAPSHQDVDVGSSISIESNRSNHSCHARRSFYHSDSKVSFRDSSVETGAARPALSSTITQWLFGSILLGCATLTLPTAFVDLIAERDLSAWKLNMNLELAIIVLTVPKLKSFGIFWACLISLSLFGSSPHHGREGEERNHLGYERLDSSGVTAPFIEETDQSVAENLNP
ncbi:hypothetical protein AKJ16_DCAP16773 [Drosera capensis]